MTEYRFEHTEDYGGIGGMWLVMQYYEPDNYQELIKEWEEKRKVSMFLAGNPPLAGSAHVAVFYYEHEAKEYCDFKNNQIKQQL